MLSTAAATSAAAPVPATASAEPLGGPPPPVDAQRRLHQLDGLVVVGRGQASGDGGVVALVLRVLVLQLRLITPVSLVAKAPAVGLQPGDPELAPVEVVDQEVGGAVDADEEVRQADDDLDDAGHLALAAGTRGVAPDQLVEVGDNLEGLADDKEG